MSGRHIGRRRQRGLSLVAAIFLLTTLASLIALMGRITAVQHTGSALSLQSSRARFAAHSGIEWGRWYLHAKRSCPPATDFAIGRFRVALEHCSAAVVSDGDDRYTRFEIRFGARSSDRRFGDPDYAAHSLRATLLLR